MWYRHILMRLARLSLSEENIIYRINIQFLRIFKWVWIFLKHIPLNFSCKLEIYVWIFFSIFSTVKFTNTWKHCFSAISFISYIVRRYLQKTPWLCAWNREGKWKRYRFTGIGLMQSLTETHKRFYVKNYFFFLVLFFLSIYISFIFSNNCTRE